VIKYFSEDRVSGDDESSSEKMISLPAKYYINIPGINTAVFFPVVPKAG